MNNNQDNNQFQNTNFTPAGAPDDRGQVNQDDQKSGNLPAAHPPSAIFGALAVVILVLIAVVAVLFSQDSAPSQSPGVDQNGVPIINLDKNQVVEKVTSGKKLNASEVNAVFRWATENPEEAGGLTAEERAGIIRVLNE